MPTALWPWVLELLICWGGGSPMGLGRPGSPLPPPPMSNVFRGQAACQPPGSGALWALLGGSELPGRK